MKKQKYMQVEIFYKQNGKIKQAQAENIRIKRNCSIEDLVKDAFPGKIWRNRVRLVLRYNHSKTDMTRD